MEEDIAEALRQMAVAVVMHTTAVAVAEQMEEILFCGMGMAFRITHLPHGQPHGIFSTRDLPRRPLQEEVKADMLVQPAIKTQLLPDQTIQLGVVTNAMPMVAMAEDLLIIQSEDYFLEAVAVQETRMITGADQEAMAVH